MLSVVVDFVRDSGPIYHETALRDGIIEPWNAFSSLTYLFPAMYFLFKAKQSHKNHRFLLFFASPLLIIGGTGSTLYHAFRSSDFLMWLDVIPIFVLTMSLGAWFLFLALRKKLPALLLLIGFILLRFVGFEIFQLQTAINISYFLAGCYIFIPAILYLRKIQFRYAVYLVSSVVMFGAALMMRYFDDFQNQLFSAGTHWLWHIFSATGAFLLGHFLYKTAKLNTGTSSIQQ